MRLAGGEPFPTLKPVAHKTKGRVAWPTAPLTSAVNPNIPPPNRPAGKAGHLFALEKFEQRLFFSADPTTQKILDTFEFVRNTIEYQPYAGLMKGATATEETKGGNAWDEANLLVKKLEGAGLGIDAKYVLGTLTKPANEVANWLGVKDVTAAQAVLNQAKIVWQPDGGMITFEHAWVKVGAIELDPSWKFKALPDVDRTDIDAIPTALKFDDAARDEYLLQIRRELPYEYFEGKVKDYLRSKPALDEVGLADVPYDGPIIAKQFDEFPPAAAGYVRLCLNPPDVRRSFGSATGVVQLQAA